jgi:Ser/Thr protein kinase RdoA (MazF antagonist)
VPELSLCVDEGEVRRVLPSWDVGRLLGLPGERGGTANPAVVVDTERGRYFLKRRNPRYAAPAFLRHDHALMEHLAAKGLCTPLALPSNTGRRWAEAAGRIYELYPYMPGEAHDPSSEEQLAEAGRQLAAFHRAAGDFSPPPGKAWPRYHDPANTIVALEWAVEELMAQTGPTPAGRTPGAALDDVRRLLDVATELAADFTDAEYAQYPMLTVHGDWHPANVKYEGGRICGIFDLDWATRQPRLVDLTDGLIYFAGQRTARMDPADIRTLTAPFELNSDRMRTFLDGYLEQAEVSEREVGVLPKFMLARWLYSRADPMRRKIPREEAVDYLLEGIWGPINVIQALDSCDGMFT